jgi:thymidine kinase
VAKLHFKYGAMNSGKSSELIRVAYNYEERGLALATMKPDIDTKSAQIVGRDQSSRAVDIIATEEMNVRAEVHRFIETYSLARLNVVLVDEAQFLQPPQVEQLWEVSKLDDIAVIAFGLRSDFQTKAFPGSQRFFELGDNFEKIKTMCRCGKQAEFNGRVADGEFIFEGAQVAIDGVDVDYESLCGTCYLTKRAEAMAETTTNLGVTAAILEGAQKGESRV